MSDLPPTWDGKDPQTRLEPYLKELKMWLATTKSQKGQKGYAIFKYATSDLKLIIRKTVASRGLIEPLRMFKPTEPSAGRVGVEQIDELLGIWAGDLRKQPAHESTSISAKA